MASNAFEPKELVSMKGRDYPVVGGRLRLAHAEGLSSIRTEIVSLTDSKAVLRATVQLVTPGPVQSVREFTGYGEADTQRDARLKDAILELAETRAIARALRFAGFGVEYTGAEEVSHLRGKSVDDDDDPNAAAPSPGPAAAPPPQTRGPSAASGSPAPTSSTPSKPNAESPTFQPASSLAKNAPSTPGQTAPPQGSTSLVNARFTVTIQNPAMKGRLSKFASAVKSSTADPSRLEVTVADAAAFRAWCRMNNIPCEPVNP